MQMWQHELTQHVSVGQKVFMAESLFFASTQLARKRINDCIFSCRDAFVFFNFKIVIDEANNPESWCARWIDLLSHFQNREICRNYRRVLLKKKKSRNGLTRKRKWIRFENGKRDSQWTYLFSYFTSPKIFKFWLWGNIFLNRTLDESRIDWSQSTVMWNTDFSYLPFLVFNFNIWKSKSLFTPWFFLLLVLFVVWVFLVLFCSSLWFF